MKKNKLIFQFIKKENGATSIFVMILMVVLIVFGLAALTTSLASLKLSGKNTAWTKEYYILEGEAERCLALIDQQLIIATDEVGHSGNDYYEGVWTKLKSLSEQNPQIQVLEEQGLVAFTVKEKKEAFPKNITVLLNILMPSYDETRASTQNRFTIIQWKEWQNQFEYDQDIDFENPNFNSIDSGKPIFNEIEEGAEPLFEDDEPQNESDTLEFEEDQEPIFLEE